MVRIRACRVRDRGSIPRRGGLAFLISSHSQATLLRYHIEEAHKELD